MIKSADCQYMARRGIGEPIAPKRIELRRASGKSAMYRSYFGCPVKANARQNTIVFKRAGLERPFLARNAGLLEAIAPQLELELREPSASEAIGGQVKTILKRLLAGYKPDIEDVARQFGVSSRTLQRRPKEAGVSFQQLMQ